MVKKTAMMASPASAFVMSPPSFVSSAVTMPPSTRNMNATSKTRKMMARLRMKRKQRKMRKTRMQMTRMQMKRMQKSQSPMMMMATKRKMRMVTFSTRAKSRKRKSRARQRARQRPRQKPRQKANANLVQERHQVQKMQGSVGEALLITDVWSIVN